MNPEYPPFQWQELMAKGQAQGFLTYAEINDALLRSEAVDSPPVDELIGILNSLDIEVLEEARDFEALAEFPAGNADGGEEEPDEANEAAPLLLANTGKVVNVDPMHLYLREMGSVDLLSRAQELAIAKRIEAGLAQAARALVRFSPAVDHFIRAFERVDTGEIGLSEVIAGLADSDDAGEIVPKPEDAAGPMSGVEGEAEPGFATS